jgi:hypothetical protein
MSVISDSIDAARKFKTLADRFAGSAYVLMVLWAVGLTVLVADDLRRAGHVPGVLEAAQTALNVFGIVVPVTIAIYRLGTFLDDWLFDPLFEPKTDAALWWLGSGMREARARAAYFMETGMRDWNRKCETQIEGIYGRAKRLYGEKTEQWKERIKLPLEISKAARCFIIPLVLVFAYNHWPEFLPRLTAPDNVFRAFAFLARPWVEWSSVILAATACTLYVVFRLDHMQKLYSLVVSDAEFRVALCPSPSTSEKVEFSCEGCVLIINQPKIRRLIRKGFDAEKLLQTLFSERLQWRSSSGAKELD